MTDKINRRVQKVEVIDSIGVPEQYSKLSANSIAITLQKSNLNKMRQRPQILNEHAESSRELIGTVTSTNIVGQIFKASQDNINGIDFTCRAKQDVVVDDFESYASDAALQAVWVETDPTDPATLETTVVAEGTQAMALPGDATVNDEWVLTISSTDLTGAVGSLFINQTHAYTALKMRFFIGDGTNTKSAPIVVQNANQWEEVEIPESTLTEDGAGTTDPTAITKVGLRLEDSRPGSTVYIDYLTAAQNAGALDIKLWDMGTSLPTSGVTTIDDGTQYEKIGDAGITGLQVSELRVDLEGGFRQYHLNGFVAGTALEIPTNELLTVDNYYMITFNYVDEEVEMYGPNASWDNYYTSGYSFDAADEATAIVATGTDEDLQFCVYSTQDVFIVNFIQSMDAEPGTSSNALINIEDSNMAITDVIISGTNGLRSVNQQFSPAYFMEKGGKFEVNYNDDPTDDVTTIITIMQFRHIDEGANG